MSNLTTQEKIDYIYNHIKKEEKRLLLKRIYKLIVYIFFIGYFAYFYLYGFEKLKNSIIESIKPNISSQKIVDGLKDKYEKLINSNKKEETY